MTTSNNSSDTQHSKETQKMAKTGKINLSTEEEAFILALRNLVGSVSDAEPVESDEDEVEDEDEDEEELEAPDRETVEGLGIKELRELAAEYGIEEKKKADILAAFEDLYDEDEEDEDEDEDEEEADEDEDEDEEGWDRDSLGELDLKELRKVAKDEGHSASEYKGMDQDDLIDLILGEEDDDEDEDDEEDEDEEAEELDEDDLLEMSHKDLIALCKELDVKVPAALKKDTKSNHKKLVAHVMDDAEEE